LPALGFTQVVRLRRIKKWLILAGSFGFFLRSKRRCTKGQKLQSLGIFPIFIRVLVRLRRMGISGVELS